MAGSTALRPIRIATRGSRQASTQSTTVGEQLQAATGRPYELVVVETVGDRTQGADVPLHTIGGQGVFVKEVQRAVLDGGADLAVHSAKDLPSLTDDGLALAAFTRRRDPRDALLGARLHDLAPGATVATGSVRRRSQLLGARPDLRFRELRGNIDTRLTKIPTDGAIVVAVAALEILGLTDRITEFLDPAVFVPAVGQGCVALEVRVDDAETIAAASTVDDLRSRRAVALERAFLAELGAGCSSPIGAHVDGGVMTAYFASGSEATGAVASIDLTSGPEDVAGRAASTDLAAAAALARRLRDGGG